jgi:hypothetical protein
MLTQRPNVPEDCLSPSLARSDLEALMARHEGLVHAVLRRQWGGALPLR